MRSLASRRLVLVAALPLAVLALRPPARGISYTFKSSIEMTDGNGRSRTMEGIGGRGQFAGDKARAEITSLPAAVPPGSEGIFKKGNVFIMKDKDETFTVLNPEKKQYFTMKLSDMTMVMGGAMQIAGAFVKIEIIDPKTTTARIGAGPTILGYSTEQYQMKQEYTQKISTFGKKDESRIESVSDFYLAPQLRNLMNPFLQFSTGMSNMVGSISPSMKKLMDETMEAQKQLYQGVPLKTVVTGTTTSKDGKVATSKMVNEVVALTKEDIPDAAFEVPSGYTLIENPTAAMAAEMEKAKAQDAANGDKKEEPASAKDAVKKGLKGLLKRP